MDFIIDFYNINKKYINMILGLIIFLAFFMLRKIISKAILSVLAKIFYSKKPERKKAFKDSLIKPLSSFFALFGLYIGISINYQSKTVTDAFKIFTIMIVCWSFLCYLSDNIQNIINLKSKSTEVNIVAVKFISNLLKILTVCIAVVMVLAELGYNINGLITGLGVGGLAVSLSAQDTLKNLISGFVILLDKPFDVGDLIETAEFKGTVEDITMRSTRIRKLDDSIIIVPNTQLADSSITNYARLTRKLVEFSIGILYSTSNDVIIKCEKEIRDYLEKNELVDNETIRVFFSEYADSSINFQIRCYVDTTDINIYNNFVEELNLAIKNIIEKNKTDFAYPTRSIILEKS